MANILILGGGFGGLVTAERLAATIDKTKHQITDSTRKNPDVRTRDITIDSSTKEKEAVNLDEERKD